MLVRLSGDKDNIKKFIDAEITDDYSTFGYGYDFPEELTEHNGYGFRQTTINILTNDLNVIRETAVFEVNDLNDMSSGGFEVMVTTFGIYEEQYCIKIMLEVGCPIKAVQIDGSSDDIKRYISEQITVKKGFLPLLEEEKDKVQVISDDDKTVYTVDLPESEEPKFRIGDLCEVNTAYLRCDYADLYIRNACLDCSVVSAVAEMQAEYNLTVHFEVR